MTGGLDPARGRRLAERLPADAYVRLVLKLYSASPAVAGATGAAAAVTGWTAARLTGQYWLAAVGFAAAAFALAQCALLLTADADGIRRSFARTIAAERRYATAAWLSAGATGALAGGVLLAADDPRIDLAAVVLSLTAAVAMLASHYRPHILHGQLAALLLPVAIALAWRGGTLHAALAAGCAILGYTALRTAASLYAGAREGLALADSLAAQNLRFDAALNNMAQGLCMFDAEGRLLVFNHAYLDIYGFSRDVVKEGLSLEALLAHSRDIGNHPDADADALFDALVARFATQEPAQFHNILGDGRTIAVSLEPTGFGGWVATHEDITERKAAEARIAHLARHDELTGLANRPAFREKLDEALCRARRGEHVAVFCLDLDRFKTVNDTLGHGVGDALLRQAAARLGACVRGSDTIARVGGDEFALVQLGAAQPNGATALAQRIHAALEAPFEVEGHQIGIGVSVGVSIAPDDGLDPERLIRNADLALYRAKGAGGRQHRFFAAEMDERMQARRSLELDLRGALAGGEFSLAYQPLVDAQCDSVSGFEALIRWHHPRRGLVMPGDFIPLAEEIALIEPIGAWVLGEACAAAAGWPGRIRVAVNLSPAQFRSGRLVDLVSGALAATGLDPDRLELEITEGVLLSASEETLATLHRLRDLGVRIAMDDFGTGYSSLSYLRAFPFDKIKIDRSFVKDVDSDLEALAIVRAVTDLSTRLGMETTAEGVETAGQLETIRAYGCTEVQGYLLGRPLPAADVAGFIRKRKAGNKAAKSAAKAGGM
jgi:diguanylate cyclase (GGDEF)-like protein/PAS domain S-box-containing protein